MTSPARRRARSTRRTPWGACLLAVAAVAAGCGGSGGSDRSGPGTVVWNSIDPQGPTGDRTDGVPVLTAPPDTEAPEVLQPEHVVGADNVTDLCAEPVALRPSGDGRLLQPSDDVDDVSDAIAGAEPGDRVLIEPGTYDGSLDIDVSGTPEQPIVIGGDTADGVVWAGGQITISGSWVTLTGITFTGTDPDVVTVTGRSTGARLHGLHFVDAGNGDDGSSVGLVKVDPSPDWSYNDTATDPPPVPIRRDLVIDANVVERPHNTVLWVSHGNTHVSVCHNRISGPHAIGGRETMALKFGFGDGTNEDAGSVVAFNTITDWDGYPYVIGIKMSGVDLVGNLIGQGRVELRSADDVRVAGNVIVDGDLQAGGRGHRIVDNYVRTVHDRDGFGPFMMYAESGEGDYDGQDGRPWFYEVFADSLVQDNTFVNAAGSAGFAVVMGHAQYETTGARPNGNVFVGDRFVSETNGATVIDNGTNADTARLLAENTFTDVTTYWSAGTAEVLPGVGNVVAAEPVPVDVPTSLRFDVTEPAA